MKKVLGLDKYRRYQRENDALGRKAMEARSENDADVSVLLVENNDKKQMITRYYVISLILVILFAGLFASIISTYGKFKLIWIDAVVFGAWLITFTVLFKVNKLQKKLIIEEHNKKVEVENYAVRLYKENQEEFYGLVVYIICINEYFEELYGLEGTKLKEKWLEITNREAEIINKSINYDISIARYQQFFSDWLKKQGIYE